MLILVLELDSSRVVLVLSSHLFARPTVFFPVQHSSVLHHMYLRACLAAHNQQRVCPACVYIFAIATPLRNPQQPW